MWTSCGQGCFGSQQLETRGEGATGQVMGVLTSHKRDSGGSDIKVDYRGWVCLVCVSGYVCVYGGGGVVGVEVGVKAANEQTDSTSPLVSKHGA